MTTLALDLGTTTGYALKIGDRVVSGTWSLRPQRFEGGGMRFVRFRQYLDAMYKSNGVRQVFFEAVQFMPKGADAGQIYGGLLAILTAWCEEHGVPYRGIGVGAIKKFWTGKGNAKKEDMMAEAVRRGFTPKDHNEADAIALLVLQTEWTGAGQP